MSAAAEKETSYLWVKLELRLLELQGPRKAARKEDQGNKE